MDQLIEEIENSRMVITELLSSTTESENKLKQRLTKLQKDLQATMEGIEAKIRVIDMLKKDIVRMVLEEEIQNGIAEIHE